MKAYVYALHGSPADLGAWISTLGQHLAYWAANAARLTMGPELPDDWEDQGAVFGSEGELRWCREEAGYRALLLTDKPVDGLPPLPGDWSAEEMSFSLQHLDDRRLKPNFSSYPHGGTTGKLRARVYYRDGMATFVSPRELLKE